MKKYKMLLVKDEALQCDICKEIKKATENKRIVMWFTLDHEVSCDPCKIGKEALKEAKSIITPLTSKTNWLSILFNDFKMIEEAAKRYLMRPGSHMQSCTCTSEMRNEATRKNTANKYAHDLKEALDKLNKKNKVVERIRIEELERVAEITKIYLDAVCDYECSQCTYDELQEVKAELYYALAELDNESKPPYTTQLDGHEPPRCQRCDKLLTEILPDEWCCKPCSERVVK